MVTKYRKITSATNPQVSSAPSYRYIHPPMAQTRLALPNETRTPPPKEKHLVLRRQIANFHLIDHLIPSLHGILRWDNHHPAMSNINRMLKVLVALVTGLDQSIAHVSK